MGIEYTSASCDRPPYRCKLCMGDGVSTGTRAFRQRTRGFMARVAPGLHFTERGGVKTRDRDASAELCAHARWDPCATRSGGKAGRGMDVRAPALVHTRGYGLGGNAVSWKGIADGTFALRRWVHTRARLPLQFR